MKNAVIWDIKTHFLTHRRNITSPLQSPAGYSYVRFEVFTAVTMENAVFKLQYNEISSVRHIKICDMLSVEAPQKKTPWPLVRERTTPIERPPLVDEI
jgi:hypothetical protein